MKIFALIFIIFFFLQMTLKAQAPRITWTRTYGGSEYDVGFSVFQNSDGGYIIVGSTESFGNGMEDVWLIRTDDNGDTLWTKTFGRSEWDIGHSVQQTMDGGFIITGEINTTDPSEGIWLIKTNSYGDTLWTKIFGFNDYSSRGNSVQQTSDSGFVITGTIYGPEPRVFLIRTDSNGDMLWMRRYTSKHTGDVECQDRGNSIQQTFDGGYIIAGSIGDWGDTDADIWLIRTVANGDTLWTKRYGGGGTDEGYSVQQTSDGGFIVTGVNRSGSNGVGGAWLLRTDAYGDTLWTKSFGGLSGRSVQITSDGGYIIIGTNGISPPPFPGKADLWLIRTDTNGDTLWTKTIGGNENEMGYSIQRTSDGGYIVAGTTFSFGSGNGDVWLIKVAPDITQVEEKLNSSIISYQLDQNFPNPFNPATTIKYQIPELSFVTLKVYGALGEEITTLVNGEKPAGSYEVRFDASKLPSGIYFYKLQAGDYIETKKMVLMK